MNRKLAAILSAFAGAFVLVASAFAIPTVYPHGVTIHEAGVTEGYVIFGAQDGQVHLVDVDGTEVHTWTFPCGVSYLPRPLEAGHILALTCGNLVEMDWDGTVVWQVAPPAGATFHHDAERLPSGNTLILCQQTINEPSISDKDILEDFIIEVAPDGSVVWEWHEADHFGEFGFSQERIDKIYALGGDWSHGSGMASIPDNTYHTDPRFIPGNIILTVRHQNTVAVIDRATSQIVYVDTDFAIGPHATHMIPGDFPGGNNLLMFDNKNAAEWHPVSFDHSKVWETDPVNGYRPYEYFDQASGLRRGAFFSHIEGGAQRLSNGNTLITEAQFGRVFEVTDLHEIIWEYVSPYFDASNSNAVDRAYKVPLDWAGPFFVPDLAVFGQDDPDHGQAGSRHGTTIRVENTGSEPAVNVALTHHTPVGTKFQSISAPADWDCSAPPVGGTGTIVCTKSSLSANSEGIFRIVVEADACGGDGTTITNTATVSSDGSDASPGDNSATIDTTVSCP